MATIRQGHGRAHRERGLTLAPARRRWHYDASVGRSTQQDPIGIAGGVNVYGFAAGDPISFSDPFGLTPACVLAPQVCWAGAAAVLRGIVSVGALAGALYADHKTALDRVNTDLDRATEHLVAGASGPDNGDEDPSWLKDKLDDARKHLNNARDHIRGAIRGSRSRREAQERIDEAAREYERLKQALPPS